MFEPGASGQVEQTIPGIGVRVVNVLIGRERSSVAAYERNPSVSYAEVNSFYRVTDHGDPHDLRVGEQWQYNSTGQTGGAEDSDIDAFGAWHVTRGSAAVAIAILDTGIDRIHENLQDRIVENYNFTKSKTVDDKYAHGTHVAGRAAAVTGDEIGVAGTCPNCVLYNGSGPLSSVAKGIRWAADNGAEEVNMTFGDPSSSRTLRPRRASRSSRPRQTTPPASGATASNTTGRPAEHRCLPLTSPGWPTTASRPKPHRRQAARRLY
jgi:thermitase